MNDTPVDLRSDTLTLPTPAMRAVMARAEVGDDVFGEDPTVRELEETTAELLRHEDAIFVPSGTMANQIAVRLHTEPGDEVFVEANAHIYYYEAGGPAALSGVMCRPLEGRRGLFTGVQVTAAHRPADQHFPRPRLVCLENTHNRGGGSVWPLGQFREAVAAARDLDLCVHLDGARLWNAALAAETTERAYAELCDTVSVCFSKGLGAPVGSALAGSKERIQRARRIRKMFGGGMRQAGIIAAGALHALRHHRERLGEDHANAKMLALGLANLPGVDINPVESETNMVRFRVPSLPAPEVAQRLREAGVWVLAVDRETIRAVTHLGVDESDIGRALEIMGKVL